MDKTDLANTIRIYASLTGDQWTSNVVYLDVSGPISEPNTSRELAVEQALSLWWESRKPNK